MKNNSFAFYKCKRHRVLKARVQKNRLKGLKNEACIKIKRKISITKNFKRIIFNNGRFFA